MVPRPSTWQLIAMPSSIGRLTNTTFPAALLAAIWQASLKTPKNLRRLVSGASDIDASPPYAVAPFYNAGPDRGAQSSWAMAHRGFVITTSAAVLVGALAGCSGSSFSRPDWLRPKPTSAQAQTLQFQSEPPGADVHTAQDQTCQTPCSLAVRSESQSVTFTKS